MVQKRVTSKLVESRGDERKRESANRDGQYSVQIRADAAGVHKHRRVGDDRFHIEEYLFIASTPARKNRYRRVF
jgi:hypothetical protein